MLPRSGPRFAIIKSAINTFSSPLGAIHKGCPHIRGKGGQAKVDKCGQGEGGGWLTKCGHPLGKKNYSYHICEIYSHKLALYSIENVWNAM